MSNYKDGAYWDALSRRDKKWDLRMLRLAKHISQWSKDPSTKVGAVLSDSMFRVLSVGYNGFPADVADENLDDREFKYARTVHAEMNAILFREGSVWGSTLYVWPMPPCSRCAGAIIQSGISTIISPPAGERWEESCRIGRDMFHQAGISVFELDEETGEFK